MAHRSPSPRLARLVAWARRVRDLSDRTGWPRVRYTATLALTPWAANALSLEDRDRISRRAVDLHCRVQAGQSRDRWAVRVGSWEQNPDPIYGPRYTVKHHSRGNLADLITRALDEYEATYVFTPDELAQIQRQSEAA